MTYTIANGTIINGKNEPGFLGSVTVRDGRILRIDRGAGGTGAGEVLDAAGAYVTPGFIDIHRHGDWQALLGAGDGGDDELLNRQGITSVVNGNCGLSVTPAAGPFAEEIRRLLRPVTGPKPELSRAEEADRDFASYLYALSRTGRTVNTGMLAGNGMIRAGIAGCRPGRLTAEEVRAARRRIEEGLAAGVLGVSLGLGYAPEFEYDAAGLIDVLEPLRGSGIPLTTHIRSEGDGCFESVAEVISVAEALGVPLHLSHMKCIGRRNWRTGPRRELELIHRKNAEGMRIDFDLFPYDTGSTQLLHVIPPSFQEGGAEAFLQRLEDPGLRRELTAALQTPSGDFENIVELVGFEQITVCTLRSERFRAFSGCTLRHIAEALGQDPYETLYEILAAERCETAMLDTFACEEDIRSFYRDPLSSVISDAIYPGGGLLHPRAYAAFPRFLIRYVRETGFLPLEEAVHKMTAAPAAALGLDRGVLEPGAPADLCVFSLRELRAPATYEAPNQLCEGFRCVMVGGQIVVRNDRWLSSAAGAGRVLLRSGGGFGE